MVNKEQCDGVVAAIQILPRAWLPLVMREIQSDTGEFIHCTGQTG